MIVSDILYGEYEVEEVLSELIQSKEVQRLKEIHMVGASYLLNPLWNETRYEHSIGVMLLIRKLGGSIEEQIAGLLHDVSHTVFPHVIDLVMKRNQEDYHEKIKEEYLKESSIPEILKQYRFDWQELLLDDTQWKILEQEAPVLCADRVDYTLREAHRYFGTDLAEIHSFLKELSLIDGKIVLRNVAAGEWFNEEYYKVVLDFFYAPVNIYGYEWMSQILTYALANESLSVNDLMETETQILTQLSEMEDTELRGLFRQFYQPVTFLEVLPGDRYDIYQKKKTRLVDPLVRVDETVDFTSNYSEKAQKMNRQAQEKSEKGIYLRVCGIKKE
ncbi:HD domain-containing protein [Enterococcus aquimarinus]|uniref:HD domain-containing protein n=1 Tax=Enterococcus aquimarinus TaxID=328396 RepID=A0A1L8QN91_9ENTE|nr:HD domain-containing protein [Enterococcus aquimarinus]OJG08970.1 hypothetical protein RU93_GL001278 [Enterococcus aquimarinus]